MRWFEKRTYEDAPKWPTERLHDAEVWAEGWNACIEAATKEMDEAFQREQAEPVVQSAGCREVVIRRRPVDEQLTRLTVQMAALMKCVEEIEERLDAAEIPGVT